MLSNSLSTCHRFIFKGELQKKSQGNQSEEEVTQTRVAPGQWK